MLEGVRSGLALGLGILLALTLVPFPLGFLTPVVLALALARNRGFGYGILLGLGFWAVHLSWLPASFSRLFGLWGGALFIPLLLLLAMYWGALFALAKRAPLAAIGVWVLGEYLWAQGTLAFPWGYLGYSLVNAPGGVIASWIGVYGLSLLVLLIAYALWHRRWWVLIPWGLVWLWPLPPVQADQQALLVQGGLSPLEKLSGRQVGARYLELTRQGLAQNPGVDLVVWPETAVARWPDGADEVLLARTALYGTWGSDAANQVRLRRGGRDLAIHEKTRLVPFGEFFPWRRELSWLYEFVFAQLGLPSLGEVRPGMRLRPLEVYAAYVCYESDFPSVARTLIAQGGQLLVNVSNDAWFSVGIGRAQHLAMARMRALETGRWLLRAANDGITASIDPYGRVVARAPVGGPAVLVAPYALRQTVTPYVRFGDAPALGGALVLVILGWVRGTWTRRRR